MPIAVGEYLGEHYMVNIDNYRRLPEFNTEVVISPLTALEVATRFVVAIKVESESGEDV